MSTSVASPSLNLTRVSLNSPTPAELCLTYVAIQMESACKRLAISRIRW